jgi:hypothetical protein
MNRETRKLLKKFKSRIARGNHYGKLPNFYVIDEIVPQAILCQIMREQHYKDTKKREIPMSERSELWKEKKF